VDRVAERIIRGEVHEGATVTIDVAGDGSGFTLR